MADKDFYEALGVARTDNEEEIRRAFRKKALHFDTSFSLIYRHFNDYRFGGF